VKSFTSPVALAGRDECADAHAALAANRPLG
jgi:hypothetical protein